MKTLIVSLLGLYLFAHAVFWGFYFAIARPESSGVWGIFTLSVMIFSVFLFDRVFLRPKPVDRKKRPTVFSGKRAKASFSKVAGKWKKPVLQAQKAALSTG